MSNLLDVVCCPNCKGDLKQEGSIFSCLNCNSLFREKEGILILISKELEEELRK